MANNKKKGKKKTVTIKHNKTKVKMPLWLFLVLVVLGAIGALIFILFVKPNLDTEEETKKEIPTFVGDGDVQIYSIEMHDKYGDSIFIKYGEYDILIDAGEIGDGKYVRDFVDSHISSDKNLDLLVATHCHSDHLAGLAKTSNSDTNPKALDNVKTISNIIDFGHQRSNYALYKNYASLRDSYINKGSNYYPAYEATHNVDGLSNTITFGDLKIEIIDTNYYLDKTTDITGSTYSYNEYSVATLITYKDTKLFCAGDLEDNGEKNLVANAANTSLNNIKESDTVIYKACHHGTDVGTANNKTSGAASSNGGNRMALLQIVKPDICFVSAAIDQSDHPFVRAVATMLYFTDYVYFNGTMGTICISLDGVGVNVKGAVATTNYKLEGFTIDYEGEKDLKYTDTVWYKNHVFGGEKKWYTGSIENPTDKELTEWYLNKLLTDYPKA